ncbi:VRR-NUC domain-containing protein [Azomonas macrocytogenes]|uniref:phosphodiesterase I n=1 Tax=Azomonas macrocytogenes TaxID=69962 RepID=A0A839T140_AZOMA|nr:VRR-NUC domain-containing protein [Azomonas macrocytogenes]MBB3102226.1 hypothetical protein [Azomonas macrocytogenes]
MRQTLDNPFYYLDNFRQVLAWIGEHHGDLLEDAERTLLDRFPQLPQNAQALLVRMVMRKGTLFRASRLSYTEIGCPQAAASPLLAEGWIGVAPQLDLQQLFKLLTKSELIRALDEIPSPLRKAATKKTELLAALQHLQDASRPFAEWCPAHGETIYELRIDALCQRLRLLFFGNLRQDWSEFVLADLGIYRYEQVAFSPTSRAFQSRRDVDDYLHLHACRERFEAGESLAALLNDIPRQAYSSAWLEGRRGKLLLRIGQQLERDGELDQALCIHVSHRYPGARIRAIRVLERSGQLQAALDLARQADAEPENETEAQQLQRILPRLQRTLGLPPPARRTGTPLETIELMLSRPAAGTRVEWAALEHLSQPDAPVHYVENGLLNSLFGLLCWEAIFAPLPGAFFHPFHAGPADLRRPDFFSRRAELFANCLRALDDGSHAERIRRTWRDKHGLLSPFVYWGLMDEALLELALACLPTTHLKICFERLLHDVPNNRCGLPDLIQFWPAERRYRMIEVKGPGDRLQDNQRRWFEHASRHGLPVAVCQVRWAGEPA